MTTATATAAAAAKIAKPKNKKVSHAKPQEQAALPLPAELGPEFGQVATHRIVVLDQVRKEFDEAALNELAMDIAFRGIMQPLTVRYRDGEYVLVAGERRLRAAKLAKLETVPVLISNISDQEHQLAQLAENIQRADLNLKEEAAAIKLLYDELGDLQRVGAKVHKSKSWVSKRLSLANGLGYYAGQLLCDGITEDIELLQTVDKLDKETSGTNATWALCERIKKGEAGREDAREALKRAKEEKTERVQVAPQEPKVDMYPAARTYLTWCKAPYCWATEHVNFTWSLVEIEKRFKYETTIARIKKLEQDLADARNARDNMLTETCSDIRNTWGDIAIDAALSKYHQEQKQ